MIENNPEELISETEINTLNEYQSDTANYLTDSDIEDERYQPNYKNHNNSLHEKKKYKKIN